MNFIRNLIRIASVSLLSKDIERYPVSQVTYNGKVSTMMTVSPYGLYSNAPLNSLALMFQLFGYEESLGGICFNPYGRFKNLEEGEVLLGNEKTQSYIKLSKSGEIEIKSTQHLVVNVTGDVTINCQNAVVNGDATINGSFSVSGSNPSALGAGGAGIARLGDTVQVSLVSGIGTITSSGTNTSI